jgi:hypothetical protein
LPSLSPAAAPLKPVEEEEEEEEAAAVSKSLTSSFQNKLGTN